MPYMTFLCLHTKIPMSATYSTLLYFARPSPAQFPLVSSLWSKVGDKQTREKPIS